MHKRYSISELADEFDVTPRTLRFYEAQGILSPEREGTKRFFSQRDRVRLRLVVRGKRLGFSLSELKNIIDMYDSEVGEAGQLQYLLKRIHDQCAELEQKRQDINDTLRELHMTAARCIEGLADKYVYRKDDQSDYREPHNAVDNVLHGRAHNYKNEDEENEEKRL